MGFCKSQYERRYMHRRAHSATVRSAETGRVVTTVKLPSKPETSAVEPRVAEYSSIWKIRARSSRPLPTTTLVALGRAPVYRAFVGQMTTSGERHRSRLSPPASATR
jgi:hypothetical protein